MLLVSHTVHGNMPMCSSSMVDSHISSVVMNFGMFMHISTAFMLMTILDISLSLPILWLCLDGQSATNDCGPGLYRIFMLYWWMCNFILCSLCNRFTTSFLNIANSS